MTETNLESPSRELPKAALHGGSSHTLFAVICSFLVSACSGPGTEPGILPAATDWLDFGPILEAGEPGEWDHYLWGAFAASVVKKDDTYFLYYQGASSYRRAFDETTCGRAIGVATSKDGVNFTKYAGNPVIRWSPRKECEEGAVSLALAVDDNGDILAFYGANTALDATNVNSDARLARSRDGLHFEDLGIVLDHDAEGRVWGAGDELFPIAAAHQGDTWLLYYIPNREGLTHRLGVAWGNSPLELTHSAAVQDPAREAVTMWGTGSLVRLSSGADILFLFHNPEDRLQAWTVSPGSPQQLLSPAGTLDLEDTIHATVLLDKHVRTWFLYYHLIGDQYRVKLAPYGEPDTTGPAPPAGLQAERTGATRIELSWSPAMDPETGVAAYNVYRNGKIAGTVNGTRFTDPVFEHSKAEYRISAINLHGVEGARSTPVMIPAAPP